MWRLAGEHGKRSIVIDVPFTYPPQPLDGLMITGYGTPRRSGTPFTYPEKLADLLPEELRQEVRVALPQNLRSWLWQHSATSIPFPAPARRRLYAAWRRRKAARRWGEAAAERFVAKGGEGLFAYPALRELVKGVQPKRRESLKGALPCVGAMPDPSAIDYSKSKVILSNFGLQIWINEQRRGGMPAAMCDELVEELRDFLLADRDRVTGRAVFRAIHRGQEVYTGPFVERAPDLVVEYNNLFDIAGADGQKNPYRPFCRTWKVQPSMTTQIFASSYGSWAICKPAGQAR